MSLIMFWIFAIRFLLLVPGCALCPSRLSRKPIFLTVWQKKRNEVRFCLPVGFFTEHGDSESPSQATTRDFQEISAKHTPCLSGFMS